jgi:hypothetical protein
MIDVYRGMAHLPVTANVTRKGGGGDGAGHVGRRSRKPDGCHTGGVDQIAPGDFVSMHGSILPSVFFGKLAAEKRAQAVSRAQSFGLVRPQ